MPSALGPPPKPAPFIAHNNALFAELHRLRERARQSDMIDDEAVTLFFEKRVPDDVYSGETFEAWRDAMTASAARAGSMQQRDLKKVTIYRSSQSGTPGTYAAVDFTGRFANAETYCGYLVWSEQADGSFLLVREEENYIYKATEAQLTPEQRAKMRGVYRCAE